MPRPTYLRAIVEHDATTPSPKGPTGNLREAVLETYAKHLALMEVEGPSEPAGEGPLPRPVSPNLSLRRAVSSRSSSSRGARSSGWRRRSQRMAMLLPRLQMRKDREEAHPRQRQGVLDRRLLPQQGTHLAEVPPGEHLAARRASASGSRAPITGLTLPAAAIAAISVAMAATRGTPGVAEVHEQDGDVFAECLADGAVASARGLGPCRRCARPWLTRASRRWAGSR